jgi:hypothetical protein
MDCLNVAFGVTERRAWWKTRLMALGLTVALSAFVIVAFVLTLFAAPLAAFVASYLGPAGGVATIVINWSLSIVLMTLVTATVYYVCPDVDGLKWQWLSPGVVVFIVGFGAASIGFSLWVARFASYDKTYGSLGAPIVLLFWLYILASFLLLGGELNALLDERRARDATEALEPSPQGVRRQPGPRAIRIDRRSYGMQYGQVTGAASSTDRASVRTVSASKPIVTTVEKSHAPGPRASSCCGPSGRRQAERGTEEVDCARLAVVRGDDAGARPLVGRQPCEDLRDRRGQLGPAVLIGENAAAARRGSWRSPMPACGSCPSAAA